MTRWNERRREIHRKCIRWLEAAPGPVTMREHRDFILIWNLASREGRVRETADVLQIGVRTIQLHLRRLKI